jgi:hypothetical protein
VPADPVAKLPTSPATDLAPNRPPTKDSAPPSPANPHVNAAITTTISAPDS